MYKKLVSVSSKYVYIYIYIYIYIFIIFALDKKMSTFSRCQSDLYDHV